MRLYEMEEAEEREPYIRMGDRYIPWNRLTSQEFGTPENPKPPTSNVESDFMSLIASCAEGKILLIAGRAKIAKQCSLKSI